MTGRVAVVVFQLGGEQYGLRAELVREVLPAVRAVPLPDAPASVAGMIDVRGALVPVLDLRARLRVERREILPSDHFVLTKARGRLVAVWVDRADALVEVDRAAFEGVDSLLPAGSLVAGVARLPDGLLLIQDPERFLSEEESRALDAAAKRHAFDVTGG